MGVLCQEVICILLCVLLYSFFSFFGLFMSSYYKYYVFFCLNECEDGLCCCVDFGVKVMQEYVKKCCKEFGINGEGCVCINKVGCLDCCEFGFVMVVYFEVVWYIFVDKEDIDEIIQSYLVEGKLVEWLMVDCFVNV